MTASKGSAKEKTKSCSYFQLYRYATTWDWICISVAIIMALIKSLIFPAVVVVYSELAALFIDRFLGIGTSSSTVTLTFFGGGKILTNATFEENMQELKNDSMSFGILLTILTAIMLVSGIIFVDLLNHVALNNVVRMRKKFFEATIRQNIGWHDMAKDQNFAVRITDNMEKIRTGMAENVGHFVQLVFNALISIVISFSYGWKLTLVIFATIPITILVNIIVSKAQSKLTTSEQSSLVKASNVAEEVIGAIRTVLAFGGEKTEIKRYEERLKPASKAGITKGYFNGLNDSVLKALMFISCAGAFWFGASLVLEDRYKPENERVYTAANLMIIAFGIVTSANHIAYLTPFLETFAMACGSAVPIFEVIDMESKIDPLSTDGKVINYGLKGHIEFEDVFFTYPAREDSIVLRGLNFTVKPGETVALVGHSGSGKSTIVQMLQRFYDPTFGKVKLDGCDIKQYNVNWLRSNMAVVGQEPVLFQGSIGENIRHGKPEATQKEVEDAARAANAHDFIIALPNSYETLISEKGVQLSGGQRQRVAIARALIQNPKILLLDEATSALDYHSEKLVQSALDKASKGRTTIVVSHRLSAICHADRIAYIENGRVVEEGTHEALARLGGKYAQMLEAHCYEDTEKEILLKEDEENFNLPKIENHRKLSDDFSALRFGLVPELANDMVDLEYNLQDFHSSKLNRNNNMENGKGKGKEQQNAEQQQLGIFKTFLRIVHLAKPEWCFLSLSTVCAALYGMTQPVFSLCLAGMWAAFTSFDESEVMSNTEKVAIISIVIGILAGITCFTQTFFFNLAGISFTTRIRSTIFKAMMRQEIAWFDQPDNSVGALSARLVGDASSVQGAIGFPLSNIIQSLTNFICSFSIAFYYSWELSLICLCTAPFMVSSIVFDSKYSSKSGLREKQILDETSKVATETITEIRTVTALRREKELIEKYNGEVERYRAEVHKRLRFRGLVNSLGMALMFFGYAVTLTYGGFMCANGRISFEEVMKISSTMLYGLFILAQSLAFTPAFNAAIVSANRLFDIIYREPKILSPTPNQDNKTNVVQGINFRDLHFAYPTRHEHQVLKAFNLDVVQGKTVALVGPSGSGKSTCIQLIQRFYDPDSGRILINEDDIHRDIEISSLRRRLGIVSQEPNLFEKTIAENIAYGDTTREVPMTQIIEAARQANAHDFITSLPGGYETVLGSKGTQLSGGQKQRIAIARAIIRNPQILLLDEATSALDLESERVVQVALDKACSGRTCIVIAHRLTTVQKADIICVMQGGRIVEKGSHPQLLALNGIYAKLYRSQPKTD